MKISIDKESKVVGELEGDELRIIGDDGIIVAKIYHCIDGKLYIDRDIERLCDLEGE